MTGRHEPDPLPDIVLDVRLAAAAELVPPGSRLADIGTDHGRLPLSLLRGGRIAFCAATERLDSGLDALRGAAAEHLATGELVLRHGDGLRALSTADRVDVVSITGLGGHTILRILDPPPAVRRLVLQPQSDTALVRRRLNERGWAVVDERLVLDRHLYYTVLAAEPSAEPTPTHATLGAEELFEAGPCLVRGGDPLVRRMWQETLERQRRILEHATPGDSRDEARRLERIARRVLEALL
ncbi:MAG: hypothetical protein GY716_12490 [bacterium]|nr:hypothetical protein [bacterium]